MRNRGTSINADDNLERIHSANSGSSNGSRESSDEEADFFEDITPPSQRRVYSGNAPQSRRSWKGFWKEATVEPVMFAHMFAISMTAVVLQNLYIDRICKISLEHNNTVCDNLANYTDIETDIDGIASKYVTYRSWIEMGFPIIFSLFLGPWTDLHGCKWPMLLPLISYSLSSLSYVIFAYIPEISPEVMLVASIPISLSGGMVAVIMSAFSFLSKLTTVENRSFRIAMLEATWGLGGPLGTLTGGLIYKHVGMSAVFLASSAILLIAFIYGAIVIHEELPDMGNRESGNCCTDMFNIGAVKDMFGVVFARRSGPRRKWLLIMLATVSLRIFAVMGYFQDMYLYTRKTVHWDLKEYTQYNVIDSFVMMAGATIMITTCMKMLKLSDAIIGILSTVGTIAAQFVFAFAHSGWMIYLGSVLQMFVALITIVLRSMVSKVVAKEEIARVFAFLACSEFTMPLIAAPINTLIFSNTLDVFPGAIFMVSAGAYSFVLLSFVYLYFSMRNTNDHVQMQNTEESSA